MGDKDKTKKNKSKRANNTGGFQRMDNPIEKVPSNAPTMAIAPSDYEHIFHEGTGIGAANQQHPPSPQQQQGAPPTANTKTVSQRNQIRPQLQQAIVVSPQAPQTSPPPTLNNEPLIVTPDGYSLLGQQPDNTNHRRVALPPYIVRASNQFSRAVLSKVAKYLASRADL